MGHRKHSAPRHGSLAFYPRKRAGTFEARIRIWPKVGEGAPRLLGFPAYKAGMVHIMTVDDRPGVPNYGKPLFNTATVLATPATYVCAARVYTEEVAGERTLGEVWAPQLPDGLERKVNVKPKPLKDPASLLGNGAKDAGRVMVLLASIPKEAGLPQKKPYLFEVEVGGGDVKARFEYAVGLLGKKVAVPEVFKPGIYIDVAGITKGKGFEGPVTRFGVKRKPHKARKSVRALGTLGPWHPASVMFSVPRAGQRGFHQRLEYNKRILMIKNEGEQPLSPKGGFPHFGVLRGAYVVVKGSVPGAYKRLVKLRAPMRPPKVKTAEPKIMEVVVRG